MACDNTLWWPNKPFTQGIRVFKFGRLLEKPTLLHPQKRLLVVAVRRRTQHASSAATRQALPPLVLHGVQRPSLGG